jgi:alkylated DNA nucleotide flippase Atl1
VLLKPAPGADPHEVGVAHAEGGRGLAGDCQARPLGPRQVLVVREEDLEFLGASAAALGANIVVRGLPGEALGSGRVLSFGEGAAEIRITHECEVCAVLARRVSAAAFAQMAGRRGALAVVLRGGPIAVGATARSGAARYPEVPERTGDRVAWVVARIPPGRVVTYDRLLALVGAGRSFFRVLPTYLRRADAAGLPAHRVLTSAGRPTGHLPSQEERLAREGITLEPGGQAGGPSAQWDARALYAQPA